MMTLRALLVAVVAAATIIASAARADHQFDWFRRATSEPAGEPVKANPAALRKNLKKFDALVKKMDEPPDSKKTHLDCLEEKLGIYGKAFKRLQLYFDGHLGNAFADQETVNFYNFKADQYQKLADELKSQAVFMGMGAMVSGITNLARLKAAMAAAKSQRTTIQAGLEVRHANELMKLGRIGEAKKWVEVGSRHFDAARRHAGAGDRMLKMARQHEIIGAGINVWSDVGSLKNLGETLTEAVLPPGEDTKIVDRLRRTLVKGYNPRLKRLRAAWEKARKQCLKLQEKESFKLAWWEVRPPVMGHTKKGDVGHEFGLTVGPPPGLPPDATDIVYKFTVTFELEPRDYLMHVVLRNIRRNKTIRAASVTTLMRSELFEGLSRWDGRPGFHEKRHDRIGIRRVQISPGRSVSYVIEGKRSATVLPSTTAKIEIDPDFRDILDLALPPLPPPKPVTVVPPKSTEDTVKSLRQIIDRLGERQRNIKAPEPGVAPAPDEPDIRAKARAAKEKRLKEAVEGARRYQEWKKQEKDSHPGETEKPDSSSLEESHPIHEPRRE